MSAAGPGDLAAVLLEAYEAYVGDFHAITRRAQGCFEGMDWQGSVDDSLERLRLYKRHVDGADARCRREFPGGADRPEFWESAKAICRGAVEDHYDADLAVMFVDSVLRRALAPQILVPYGADSVDAKCDPEIHQRIVRTYEVGPQHTLLEVVERLLLDCGFLPPFRDLRGDAAGAAQAIEEALGGEPLGSQVEVLRPVFYRNKGAYVAGRIRVRGAMVPLTFALGHTAQGIFVDAVLTEESDLRRIFSYTRSNFHVELEGHYREVLDFLASIMPHKNQAALCSSIGFMNPAKIQLWKDLEAHRRTSARRMTAAWGIPGLVMVVFTPPGFPYVFKVIRDDDKVTKSSYIGRQGVRDKYRLVQEGDRVGRLLDTITFHHLRFCRDDFEPKILHELLQAASATVTLAGDDVVINHCYAQREATPLPIYLRQCDWPETQRVLNDLGWCLKDLAAAGLFPGEFDLKNFGVAEDGRVVFFDFDGLDVLGKFNFDEVPLETSLGQEESFEYLLHEYRVNLVDLFRRLHPDLFMPAHWKGVQSLLRQGEVLDTFPYPPQKRLETRRRFRFPAPVVEALDRFGLSASHRRGLIGWDTRGAGMTVGRSPAAGLSEAQRAAVREALGVDEAELAARGLGIVLVEGAPAFLYVPGATARVLDLLGHYPLAGNVAAHWRERVRREVFDRVPASPS